MFMEMRLERRMELVEREEQRIATRAAVATVAALALALAGVVATATALGAEDSVAVQVLATSLLPLSAAAGVWAFGLRLRLGEIRGRKAKTRSALEEREDEDPFADIAPGGSLSPADLIALERVLRTFYEAPSGAPADKQWDRFRALFAPGALVETGGGGPSEPDVPVERFVALARREARDVWLREVERTLHVLGDVAVAVSAFEAHPPSSLDALRGVNVLRLRKARGTWAIEGLTSRPGHAVTVRRTLAPTSRPRPPPRAA